MRVMESLARLMTKRNLEILEFIARAERPPCIREIAERIGCSPAKAHQAVVLFRKEGMVTTERKKNTLTVQPDRSNALYQRIKSAININAILKSKAYRQLKKQGIISVYGSYAKGTDDHLSDVDLLIVTNEKSGNVIGHASSLGEELRREVRPFRISPEGLRKLERKDEVFSTDLRLTAIGLNGDPFDSERVF